METAENKPVFDKRIFWDVDFEKLDYDAKASFIIERVFDRAMWKIYANACGIMAMRK